jgi:hypothetical protein
MDTMWRLQPLALGISLALQLGVPGARAGTVVLTPSRTTPCTARGTISNGAGRYLFSVAPASRAAEGLFFVLDVAASVPPARPSNQSRCSASR